MHDTAGACLANYTKAAEQLYKHAYAKAKGFPTLPEPAELVTSSTQLPATQEQQRKASWLFYKKDQMTPAEWTAAFAIHVRCDLYDLPAVWNCNCGKQLRSFEEKIVHMIDCDKATSVTHVHRHNLIRDELVSLARDFGIAAIPEPHNYEDNYGPEALEADNEVARQAMTSVKARKQRPDVLFFTPQCVSTDVTIVGVKDNAGSHAAAAAKDKTTKHCDAVGKRGHEFIPFAMEPFGFLEAGCDKLMKALLAEIPDLMKREFPLAFTHRIAVALARGRALTLQALNIRLTNLSSYFSATGSISRR
jgi:hypothetical protein